MDFRVINLRFEVTNFINVELDKALRVFLNLGKAHDKVSRESIEE